MTAEAPYIPTSGPRWALPRADITSALLLTLTLLRGQGAKGIWYLNLMEPAEPADSTWRRIGVCIRPPNACFPSSKFSLPIIRPGMTVPWR